MHTLHSSESQEATQSVTPVIQLFIHWKLIRSSHFVRQCTGIVALTAARSPFQECQSSHFSRVLQAESCFYVHETPPEQPTSAQELLTTFNCTWLLSLPGKGVGIIPNYWLHMKSKVLHTAKTGLLPRTKGWHTGFV